MVPEHMMHLVDEFLSVKAVAVVARMACQTHEIANRVSICPKVPARLHQARNSGANCELLHQIPSKRRSQIVLRHSRTSPNQLSRPELASLDDESSHETGVSLFVNQCKRMRGFVFLRLLGRKRMHRRRFVKPDPLIELVGKRSVEIMTEPLGLGAVDYADRPL
jgi:hypothetical protein